MPFSPVPCDIVVPKAEPIEVDLSEGISDSFTDGDVNMHPDSSGFATRDVEQPPLTSSPSVPLSSRLFQTDAITSLPSHNSYNYNSQDVRPQPLNQRAHAHQIVTNNRRQHDAPSASSSPSAPYAVANSSTCLRTPHSKVFESTKDLAAEYGLPDSLPALPSLAPKPILSRSTPAAPSTRRASHTHAQDPLAQFQQLSSNYMRMLASPPGSSATESTMPPPPAPNAVDAPLDLDSMMEELIKESPQLKDQNEFPSDGMAFPAYSNAFDSPLSAPPQPFMTSPFLSDYDPTSPLFGSGPDDFTSPLFSDASPLFQDGSDFETSPLIVDNPNPCNNGMDFMSMPLFAPDGKPLPTSNYVPRTPGLVMDSSPNLDTPTDLLATPSGGVGFTGSPLIVDNGSGSDGSLFPELEQQLTKAVKPASTSSPASRPTKPLPRTQQRRSTATGTRKNITPQSLLDEAAPTQTRKYALPSATSRKEVPATFARKRAAAAAAANLSPAMDDDEELPELPPNATEKEQIEWKRRQNTIAARKSRKRKLEHQQHLESELERLKRDRDLWKVRALTLRGVLKGRGEEGGMEDWEEESD